MVILLPIGIGSKVEEIPKRRGQRKQDVGKGPLDDLLWRIDQVLTFLNNLFDYIHKQSSVRRSPDGQRATKDHRHVFQ